MRKQNGKGSKMRRPRIVSETEDFRIYEKETVCEADGRTVVMHLCEELVEGRWEPFYATDLVVNPDESIKYSRLGRKAATIDNTPSNE